MTADGTTDYELIERQEWDEDPDTESVECDRCGEHKFCLLASDPFVVEGINDGPMNEMYWCYDCFEERTGDT